jgi:hypothetical protein
MLSRLRTKQWFPVPTRHWQNMGESMKKKWEQLGLEQSHICRNVQHSEEMMAFETELIKAGRQGLSDCRRSAITQRFYVAVISSIVGIDQLSEFGLDSMQHVVRVGMEKAVDYFHGSWRNGYRPYTDEDLTLDVEGCRQALEWIDPYREGLICALYVEDRESFHHIMKWTAGGGLFEEEGTLDRTKDDCAFYELLGAHAAGNEALVQSQLQVVRNARRTRVKLLAAMFEAMLAKDTKAFARATNKYLAGYKKTEYRTNRLDAAVSLDGTIVWGLGKYAGCADIRLIDVDNRLLLVEPMTA